MRTFNYSAISNSGQGIQLYSDRDNAVLELSVSNSLEDKVTVKLTFNELAELVNQIAFGKSFVITTEHAKKGKVTTDDSLDNMEHGRAETL